MTEIRGRENTAEEIERGKAFALWLRHGMAAKGLSPKKLEEVSKVSQGYIGRLAKGGVNTSTGRYMRPGEKIIVRLADALELDANEGKSAAGWKSGDTAVPQKIFRYDLGIIAGAQTSFASAKELTKDEIDRVGRAIRLALE